MTLEEAEDAIKDMLAGNAFGDAGSRVVIEEFLDGEEASFIVMVDGENVLPMATSQDHKRVGDKTQVLTLAVWAHTHLLQWLLKKSTTASWKKLSIQRFAVWLQKVTHTLVSYTRV